MDARIDTPSLATPEGLPFLLLLAGCPSWQALGALDVETEDRWDREEAPPSATCLSAIIIAIKKEEKHSHRAPPPQVLALLAAIIAQQAPSLLPSINNALGGL